MSFNQDVESGGEEGIGLLEVIVGDKAPSRPSLSSLWSAKSHTSVAS